ncbi:hypothetical protein [Streptomyces erythrochromogenes]
MAANEALLAFIRARLAAEGALPYIDLWAGSQLETLLAQRPHIAAAHGLR